MIQKPKQNFAKTEKEMIVFVTKKYEKTINKDGVKILNGEFEMLEKIGNGTFWSVRKVRRNKKNSQGVLIDNSLYALKKGQLNKKDNYFSNNTNPIGIREYNLLKQICHPNIVRLFECIVDNSNNIIAFVMQYCQLGELMRKQFNPDNGEEEFIYNIPLMKYFYEKKYLKFSQKNEVIPEEFSYDNQKKFFDFIAKKIFLQLSKGLDYLHNKKLIVHLDIKPSNILVEDNGDDNQEDYVKLSDFSVSQQLNNKNEKLNDYSGTPIYLPPEIEEEGELNPFKCDVYSLGATVFTFLFNSLDFQNYKDYLIKIEDKQLKTALEKSMERDFNKRAFIEEIIQILENQD